MYKLFFALLLGGLSSTFAQKQPIKSGTWKAGGSVQYMVSSYQSANDPGYYTSKVLGLYPDLQYVVLDGLALGASLDYATIFPSKSVQHRSHSYSVGPKATYFLPITWKNVQPFAAGRIYWQHSKQGTYEQKGKGWGGYAGLQWLVRPSVGLLGEFFVEKTTAPGPNNGESLWTGKGFRVGLATYFN